MPHLKRSLRGISEMREVVACERVAKRVLEPILNAEEGANLFEAVRESFLAGTGEQVSIEVLRHVPFKSRLDGDAPGFRGIPLLGVGFADEDFLVLPIKRSVIHAGHFNGTETGKPAAHKVGSEPLRELGLEQDRHLVGRKNLDPAIVTRRCGVKGIVSANGANPMPPVE